MIMKEISIPWNLYSTYECNKFSRSRQLKKMILSVGVYCIYTYGIKDSETDFFKVERYVRLEI